MKTKEKTFWYKNGRFIVLVVLTGMLYFFNSALGASSNNSVFPLLGELYGFDYTRIQDMLTYGNIAVALLLPFSLKAIEKWGPKKMTIISLSLTTVCVIIQSFLKTQLGIGLIVAILTVTSHLFYYSIPVIIGNWCPRTRGMVLGWVTIGIVLPEVTWAIYMPDIMKKIGVQPSYFITAGVMIVLLVLIILCVRNTPEEYNLFPDNKQEGYADFKEQAKKINEYKSDWTLKRVYKTKECWLIVFGTGFTWLACLMFMSSIVGRVISLGHPVEMGLQVLQLGGLVAIVGSFVLGWLDQKLTTKVAGVIFTVWLGVMLILALFMGQSTALIWISTFGIMFAVGGIPNLTPSLIIGIWGRWDFPVAQRAIMFPVQFIKAFSFLILAMFLRSPYKHTAVYLFGIGCCILGCICMSILKMKKLGKQD